MPRCTVLCGTKQFCVCAFFFVMIYKRCKTKVSFLLWLKHEMHSSPLQISCCCLWLYLWLSWVNGQEVDARLLCQMKWICDGETCLFSWWCCFMIFDFQRSKMKKKKKLNRTEFEVWFLNLVEAKLHGNSSTIWFLFYFFPSIPALLLIICRWISREISNSQASISSWMNFTCIFLYLSTVSCAIFVFFIATNMICFPNDAQLKNYRY